MLCVSWSKITKRNGRVRAMVFGSSISAAAVGAMSVLVTAAACVPCSSSCSQTLCCTESIFSGFSASREKSAASVKASSMPMARSGSFSCILSVAAMSFGIATWTSSVCGSPRAFSRASPSSACSSSSGVVPSAGRRPANT